ncbi:MAG: YeeE/YedE family protein [Nitrosomonas sp.]|nr:YeeE/YedE family protein [Nitrosomonas sp.]
MNLDAVPWNAAVGGLMIGAAVTLLLLFNGCVAGVSGMVGGLYRVQKGDIGWRVTFILGLILSVVIWRFFFVLPEIVIETNYTMLALAGFLVGYGTRLGSGCTSGHGVCGISRRSPRSIAATIVFMLAGFMTVYLLRHVFTFWLG